MAKDAPNMKGVRSRDKTGGRLRKKRADTRIATLAKRYHRRFAGHMSWQLGTLLKKWRKPSLKKAIRLKRRAKRKRKRGTRR